MANNKTNIVSLAFFYSK